MSRGASCCPNGELRTLAASRYDNAGEGLSGVVYFMATLLLGYCSTSSTRRFLAFPSSALLDATGQSEPTP